MAVTFGDGQVERVTFEYHDDVRGIEAVVDALREVRRSFPTPPPPRLPRAGPRPQRNRAAPQRILRQRQGRSSMPNETRPWE